MISFDTNIAVHAANQQSEHHLRAREFVGSLATNRDVAICELMLVELYLKLRNERIFPRPLTAAQASSVCLAYRSNQAWKLIECAPVMDGVWDQAGRGACAFRRIIDIRLASTLMHHGVTEFATANTKDFSRLGFARVWNPLLAGG
jgi:toxin-antitoxin system PIN domain toxin